MATNDVPGANAANYDTLDVGCWAEHADGSLIFVEGLESGNVIYSMFDLAADPPIEWRDGMAVAGFKKMFTWDPKDKGSLKWTWHDKTRFDWTRVMAVFPAGQKHPSAAAQLSAAQQVADSLNLRAGAIRRRDLDDPQPQPAANTIMTRIKNAVAALRD